MLMYLNQSQALNLLNPVADFIHILGGGKKYLFGPLTIYTL